MEFTPCWGCTRHTTGGGMRFETVIALSDGNDEQGDPPDL